MKTEQPPTRPPELNIDVDQWRRDIATFAATTQQALAAIIAQLSSSCSDGFDGRKTSSTGTRVVPTGLDSKPALKNTQDSDSRERLEQLKLQLSQRIANSR